MGVYIGDFAADATVRKTFNTVDSDGAPITLGGTPTVGVFKDGVIMTLDGGTTTLSVDATDTGRHTVTVDTSNDADFAIGSDYEVFLSAGTVDGTSVEGASLFEFSLENRNDKADIREVNGSSASVSSSVDANLVTIDSSAPAMEALKASALFSPTGTVTGTVTTTSCTTSSYTGYTDDMVIGRGIAFLAGGTAAYSFAKITDYTSSTGALTWSPATAAAATASDAVQIIGGIVA